MTSYYVLTEEAAVKLGKAIERLSGTQGMTNTPSGLLGALDRALQQPYRDRPEMGMWMEITGNATNGTNQWKYSWKRVVRTSTGWQDAAVSVTGSTSSDYALNSLEKPNSGSGVQGNGVDLDGQVFTDNSDLELQPIATGAVVWAWRGVDASNNPCLTFTATNAIDGECA